ncbi:TIM-barrel domain-containing protein [Rhodanobacter sp. C01]|uniref:glycoside hydrolase family 31 protein n=1 Tax=Rhodanobacter sp. C01 TaxID=1945856 RepID=UPI0009D0610C|nr:TIM-barrel domain-containing protein [Rhodanobacter sp. C01]OOG45641.1 glycoside hydrolase family 31 [Rhodanobacter sp. C01]
MTIHLDADGMTISNGAGTTGIPLIIRFDGAGIVHVRSGVATVPSALVLDPHSERTHAPVKVHEDALLVTMTSSKLSATWHKDSGSLSVDDADGRYLLTLYPAMLGDGKIALTHARGDALYGIHGFDATASARTGLLRERSQVASAGEQGNAGAPFVWSTTGYGVLVDSDSKVDFQEVVAHPIPPGNDRQAGPDQQLARLDIQPVKSTTTTKPAMDFYILVGQPRELFGELAGLSGRSPLFPKWAMGFTNSQWGIDQQELLQIVDTYRAKHIPIDNITLDFDWKAWGEDWGEFRWNATKFPGGPDGRLKTELDQRGVHLTGIMKPRVHVDTVEGRYATAHDLWRPDEKATPDYFSHKPVKDIDFDKPAARGWFFNDALKHSFATGIIGWWNDEADNTPSNTQFLNMQRALYDGQRAISNQRVWSINRNFWLGSQRYAYGLWSGDIPTGFASMAGQRARMLSAINVGAMQWGMDGGGFKDGTPTPENYARWIEFGAFTPIFRVHGDFGQKRQPWVYGPVAEKAATDAIRLRYTLIPYIYSYEYQRRVSGVGLVRPLLFDWPGDPQVRNDIGAWMFGDYLLVSPVVEPGQASKDIYLPAGRWTDWSSGKVYQGGQTIHLAIDSRTWSDIPLFIRDGAIIPNRPAEDYVGQHPLTQLDVEVFPAAQRNTFDYYDDDGSTYDYEHGQDYRQTLAVQRNGDTVQFDLGAAAGSFKPALQFYLLKIHGGTAATVSGHLKSFDNLNALQHSADEGWARGHDRYGDVTYVRVTAAQAASITLDMKR